jgi:hypothetical protein
MAERMRERDSENSRVRRRLFFLTVSSLLLALLIAGPAGLPVSAHTDSPGSPPLAPSPFRLKHRQAAEIIALFSRERLPDAPGDSLPRAARTDTAESLVPSGADAILRGEAPGEVVLVGTEAVPRLCACVELLDTPRERTGPDREKVVLTLRQADARRLRTQVLRLPSAGSAAVQGTRLVLEGDPAWLHRALRQVIRAELRMPETAGLPSP